MKKTLLVILICFICTCIIACANTKYTDTHACKELCHSATSSLSDGLEYAEHGDAHKRLYFSNADIYDDVCILYSTDTNDINEIGIFHATDADAARELEKNCLEYLESIREGERAFIASYAPDELPKLDGAKVKRYGNYVVYTVLPTDSANDTHEQIKNIIKR